MYVDDTERFLALCGGHPCQRGRPREDMAAKQSTHAHWCHNVENPKAVNQLSLFLLTNSVQNDFTEALDVHNAAEQEDKGLYASEVLMAKKSIIE